ncbi:MAG: aminopeptidase [Agathobacter sp.]|nr:aminopeptidase [Agathobacter sp.]
MKYLELIKESNEEILERYELVCERVGEIAQDASTAGKAADYFARTASHLCSLYVVAADAKSGKLAAMSLEEGQALNAKLCDDVHGKNYETSYANPAYAAAQLGLEAGQILSALYTQIRGCVGDAMEGNLLKLCIYSELFVEVFNYFEEEECDIQLVKSALYSFQHDYTEVFNEDYVARYANPDYDYYMDILMEADLSEPSYLYRYGLFVGDNELASVKFLNTLSTEEIKSMASTYTEGYRIGFIMGSKDLSKKTVAEVRYPIGFELMVREAVKNFAEMGLGCVLRPYSTQVNKQYTYDHREDNALWLDKAYVERSLEVYRTAFEKHKVACAGYAGPAVIEVFGEEPFSPKTTEEALKLSDKQQQTLVYQRSEYGSLLNQYIKGEERSFTIIAYPIAEIGEKFEEIFAETVKINTLDYILYRDMQQKMIDVLDTGKQVHILGANGNKTDLYVTVSILNNPEKETAFENCVADVNIPVGEVFTSPVLKGTTGKLHVSQVYLRDYNFLNLEIDFVDGMITNYTCTNFETEEENQKYIRDNILSHHETLPMGEFAIGTNTTAYRMARVYDIAAKLPILIAEKTGPHFAVGDTCFKYDEDNVTYNPDGKAIIARENEVSALRKTDPSKAYFNCHTDITIPYDELAHIRVIKADGTTEDIIRDGRFVLAGTEELNKPLDEME